MASRYAKKSTYEPANERKFFASLKSAELPAAVWCRYHDGQATLRASSRHNRLIRSLRAYYSLDLNGADDTKLQAQGKRGQSTRFAPNFYRNFAGHVMATVLGSPTRREAMASNSDSESMQQAMLADGIMDYYAHDRVDTLRSRLLERALVLTEGWVGAPWDPNSGPEVGVAPPREPVEGEEPKEGEPEQSKRLVYGGDFDFEVYTPYQVVSETSPKDKDQPAWVIVERMVSRYDLAELFPEYADEIMCAPGVDGIEDFEMWDSERKYDDKIPVLHLAARRGPALISGREAWILSEKTALWDDSLGYKTLPYFRCSPADVMMGDGGYSNQMDTLGPQEAINKMATALVSNNVAFGQQMIATIKGSGLRVKNMGNLVELEVASPQMLPIPVQLTKSAPEAYTLLEMLISFASQFSGVSDAQRGAAGSMKGDSGAKQALIASLAQQFQGPVAQALARCEERLWTHVIDTVKDRVTDKRIASIAGRYNADASKSWSGKDVEGVSAVKVRTGSGALGTAEQRLQVLTEVIMKLPNAAGFVNPEQVIAWLETGRFEPITERAMKELTLIRRENELLMDEAEYQALGKPLQVAPTHQHQKHVWEHSALFDDPQALVQDQAMIDRALEHIKWHIECLTPGMPRFAGLQVLTITGQQPLPLGDGMPKPEGMGAPPPGAPGKPPQKAPGAGGGPSKAGGGSGLPSMPSVPKSAATGQPAAPAGLPAPGNQVAG